MMGCCWLRTGLVVFILYIDLVCSVKKFTPQTSKNSELRKIAVDSTGRNIYVGGKNFIYHLNEDLTQVGVVETGPREDSKECTKVDVDSKKSGCNIKEYDDYTQLLQVYEPGGILVTCGTLYLGRCVGRDLQNISIVNATSTSYLAVSADETVSTESVIAKVGTESLLFVGKSYVKTTENLENIYTQVRDIIYGGRLQENKFLGPYETNSGVKPTFSIKTVNKHADQKYDFVMKSMFYMSDNIYSLVRIMDLTTRRTVSKLSKMCAMGTSGANSYEDMPIECSEFSYVRDGFVVQHGSGEVLVALFSSTLDVTETTRCAVCVFTEDELLEGFRRSRMNHSSCGIPGSYPVDYLEIQENRKCMNNCLTTEPLCTILNTTTYCNGLLSLSSLIGVIPLTASPVYRGTGLTSLGGSFRNNLTAILVGTQTGTLHKLFLKSETAARLVKTSANYLDPPVQPIIDIVTTELNRTYLLGRHSVALLEDPVNCTKDSCSECMKIADSKCGWCVLDGGSCMEKTSCNQDEFWLPSLGGECLTLSTIPPGIRHQFTSLMTNVTVILSPPVPLTGNDWQCQYGSDECKPKGIPCKSDLIISESTMICQIQAREAFQQEYKLADFKIISKSIPSKVLAEGWSLLFYDCKGFKTCFECVNNPKAIACFWKTTEAECVNTHDSLYISYKNTSDCPQLSEMQIKLHKDKQTTVVIQAENLPSVNKTLYTCTVSNMPGIVSKVYTTEVICEVKVSLSGNVTVTYNRINIDHNGTVASKGKI